MARRTSRRNSSRAAPDALRIPLDPSWERGRTRAACRSNTRFASPEDSGARYHPRREHFHLGSRGWFPELQPPKHVLSPYPSAPEDRRNSRSAFLPISSSCSRGRFREEEESGGRNRIPLRSDATMMCDLRRGGKIRSLAGAAQIQCHGFLDHAAVEGGSIRGRATDRLRCGTLLEKDFGPLDKNIAGRTWWNRPDLRGRLTGEPGPAAVAFPGGALVNAAALALGTGSDQFLEMVTHALAHDWFGEAMYLSDAAAVGMGEGLPEYATIVIDEARNGPESRRRRVTEYLRRYDEARKAAAETPLAASRSATPPGSDASLLRKRRCSSSRWRMSAAKGRCTRACAHACHRARPRSRLCRPALGARRIVQPESSRRCSAYGSTTRNPRGFSAANYQGSAVGEVAGTMSTKID